MQHTRVFHSAVIIKLKCPVCGGRYTNRSNVRTHYKRKHKMELEAGFKFETVEETNQGNRNSHRKNWQN